MIEKSHTKKEFYVLTFMYLIEKRTCNIPATFVGETDTSSILKQLWEWTFLQSLREQYTCNREGGRPNLR